VRKKDLAVKKQQREKFMLSFCHLPRRALISCTRYRTAIRMSSNAAHSDSVDHTDLLQRLSLSHAQDEVPDSAAEEEDVRDTLAGFREEAAQQGMSRTPISTISPLHAHNGVQRSGTSTPVVDDRMSPLLILYKCLLKFLD